VRGSGSVAAVQWVLSGLFDRFPTLRIFFAENQIGWIPFFLQAADVRYERHHRWAERLLGLKPLKRPPSDYMREHFLWGFQFDRIGVELRHKIKVDHLMWGSDFPHQESDWPESLKIIDKNFAGVRTKKSIKWFAATQWTFFDWVEEKPTTKSLVRQSRNQTKRWVNQEGHEAHEGYDLGEFETPPLKIIFLSFNFVLFAFSW